MVSPCSFSKPLNLAHPGFPILFAFVFQVFGFLRKRVPEEMMQDVKRMSITLDGRGAVFDVPSDSLKEFLKLVNQNEVSLRASRTNASTAKR